MFIARFIIGSFLSPNVAVSTTSLISGLGMEYDRQPSYAMGSLNLRGLIQNCQQGRLRACAITSYLSLRFHHQILAAYQQGYDERKLALRDK